MTPTIFKINKYHHKLNDCDNKGDIINKIIEIAETEDNIQFQKSLNNSIHNTPVHFFTYRSKEETVSGWYNFLAEEVEVNEANFEETKVSVVIFFEADNFLYCISGGSGYNIIKKFIDSDFGLTIFSRIYAPTHQIKSLETRNISGLLYNSNNQYATNFNAENLAFSDKIIQKLTVELEEKQDFFTVEDDSLGGLVIKFDSGIQLKNNVNLSQLICFIKEIDDIFQFPQIFEISNYSLIEDVATKKSLNHKLIEELKADFINIERNIQKNDRDFSFEFCTPKNVQAFYDSISYSWDYKKKNPDVDWKSDRRYNINELDILFLNGINYLLNAQIIDGSSPVYRIKAELMNLGLVYYVGDVPKRSSFFHSLNTEIEYNGTKYFFINSKWYKLSSSIQKNLNEGIKQIFQNSELSEGHKLLEWNQGIHNKEGEYNLSHQSEDVLVLDKCIIDNIELCDILKFDHQNQLILLYHVKQKFSHDIRVLCNQINVAAKKVNYIKNGRDQGFFDKLIVHSTFLSNNGLISYSSEEFLRLFETYQIAFVLCVTGNKHNHEIKTNAEAYNSTIAKFSIIELHQIFKSSYDYSLYYEQIFVSNNPDA